MKREIISKTLMEKCVPTLKLSSAGPDPMPQETCARCSTVLLAMRLPSDTSNFYGCRNCNEVQYDEDDLYEYCQKKSLKEYLSLLW
jgi:hypothetical protein